MFRELLVGRAKPGETILLYGVGFGSVSPNNPAGQIVQASNTLAANLQISIGGVAAVVTYDGLAPGAGGALSVQRGGAERSE